MRWSRTSFTCSRRRFCEIGCPCTLSASALRHDGFVSEPTPSISIVISSPGCEQPLRVAEDADAGGRAGQDQVAGLESRRLRDVAPISSIRR
jgi:hypothetical protein